MFAICCPSGEVLMQSGDTGKGIEAFEKAIQLAPNDENLLLSAAHRLRYTLPRCMACIQLYWSIQLIFN